MNYNSDNNNSLGRLVAKLQDFPQKLISALMFKDNIKTLNEFEVEFKKLIQNHSEILKEQYAYLEFGKTLLPPKDHQTARSDYLLQMSLFAVKANLETYEYFYALNVKYFDFYREYYS